MLNFPETNLVRICRLSPECNWRDKLDPAGEHVCGKLLVRDFALSECRTGPEVHVEANRDIPLFALGIAAGGDIICALRVTTERGKNLMIRDTTFNNPHNISVSVGSKDRVLMFVGEESARGIVPCRSESASDRDGNVTYIGGIPIFVARFFTVCLDAPGTIAAETYSVADPALAQHLIGLGGRFPVRGEEYEYSISEKAEYTRMRGTVCDFEHTACKTSQPVFVSNEKPFVLPTGKFAICALRVRSTPAKKLTISCLAMESLEVKLSGKTDEQVIPLYAPGSPKVEYRTIEGKFKQNMAYINALPGTATHFMNGGMQIRLDQPGEIAVDTYDMDPPSCGLCRFFGRLFAFNDGVICVRYTR